MPLLTSSGNENPSWAIVIHGGAGSDPKNWNEAKTKIREAGLQRALTAGRDALANGRNALDTVELVIRILEDDAAFNAGRGAVLTKEGKVELDASIMDGKTRACGAVASLTATIQKQSAIISSGAAYIHQFVPQLAVLPWHLSIVCEICWGLGSHK